MKNFILLVVALAAIWLGVTAGWESAFWLVVLWGCVLFAVYAVMDLAGWFWDRLTQRQISIRIYDQEREQIVDAEIVKEEEVNRKWWEV